MRKLPLSSPTSARHTVGSTSSTKADLLNRPTLNEPVVKRYPCKLYLTVVHVNVNTHSLSVPISTIF